MIPLITTALTSRWAAYAAALGIAIAGAYAWRAEHDAGVRAALLASQQAAETAEQLANNSATIAALQSDANRVAIRTQTITITKDRIIHVPITQACATSPAVRLALDSLRQQGAAGTSSAPHTTAGPPLLPAAANATSKPH